MLDLQKLQQLRWYDAVSFTLNKVLAGHYAQCYPNLSYADTPRQVLDLYCPHHKKRDAPLVIFVHGGSWQRGQKDDYIFLAQSLAQEGMYVATVNYQLAPMHQFPAFVDDVAQAINYLQQVENSERFGYNRDQVILLGHSAGAFNVMSAVYPTASQQRIAHLAGVKAVIGIAGPYSFEHRGDPVAQFAFDQSIAPQAIMPNYFVSKNHIQHLLLLAGKDQLVADDNTYHMQKALQEVGNAVEVLRVARTNHISIIATLTRGIAKVYPTKAKLCSFIEKSLQSS